MSTARRNAARRHRIEVRVTPDQAALLRHAASIADETVTAFILGSATERAHNLVDAERTATLRNETFDRLHAALDEPATVVPELVALLQSEPLPRR